MNERELISQIGGIARLAPSLDEAVTRIERLLAGEIGSATLLLRPVEKGSPFLAGTGVSGFLESHEFPFRGLYTAPLVKGDRPRGMLIACFGSWGAPGELLQRITACTADQLGALPGRVSRTLEAA